MLKNQWYAICESHEITQQVQTLKRLNQNFVLYRTENHQVVCFDDICIHRGASLGHGKLQDGCLVCPFHGFEFNSHGECTKIPANGQQSKIPKRFKLKQYQIYEIDNFIFIYYGDTTEEQQAPEYFTDLLTGFSYGSKCHHWDTHYSRAIENQLDIIHVPFVHPKTIGRSQKTLVNGPVVKWNNNTMTFYVLNEHDEGQKTLKPAAMEEQLKSDAYHLKFIMPNLWQNYISDDVRIMIAFVPVDDDDTLIYLRFYQKFLTVPVIKTIVNRLAMIFNNRILNEDYAIIRHELPRVSYETREMLIQGDLTIGEYRRKYRELFTCSEIKSDLFIYLFIYFVIRHARKIYCETKQEN